MLIQTLKSIFTRDLNRLQNEIELYQDEKNIWKTDGQIKNPAGNLCLHLIGNLNTYIGKELGNLNYVRNREAEFSAKDISREELIRQIKGTIEIVNATLSALNEKDLEEEYPITVFEEKTSTGHFLVHLATHLTYHLGQVNYHRRLVER